MRPDAVVIGGGVAGLATATALAERGARVRVLEARAQPGGRSRSWVDPAIGEVEDNGQHLVLGCYDEFLAFVRRTGGIESVRFDERLDLVMLEPGGGVVRFRPPALPSPLDLLFGILGLAGFPLVEAVAAAALVADVRRGGPAPGTTTVAAWLAGHGQGPRSRRLLWDPIVLATLNLVPERACASLLVPVLARALLGGRDASRVGLPRRGLTPLVVDPAVSYLTSRGGGVVGSVRVDRLETDGDRVSAALARDGTRHEGGVFVLAAPHAEAARLLPAGASPFDAAAASGLSSSPIVAVHLWLDAACCPWPMAAFLDGPFHWVFDRGSLGGAGPSGYLALVASGADLLAGRPALEVAASAVDQVRRFLPRARAASVVRTRVVKERHATPAFTPETVRTRPGAPTAIRNLLLAGDWTDTGLPATLEGAAQSGHLAARLAQGA